jgi:hypothetical protein
LSKCTFAHNQIAYLGHIISQDRVSIDLAKVSSIANWPTPQNAKELRSFLGLSGYYKKFISSFCSHQSTSYCPAEEGYSVYLDISS